MFRGIELKSLWLSGEGSPIAVGASPPIAAFQQGLRMKCGNKHGNYGLLVNFRTQLVCHTICPGLQPGINSQFPVELP